MTISTYFGPFSHVSPLPSAWPDMLSPGEYTLEDVKPLADALEPTLIACDDTHGTKRWELSAVNVDALACKDTTNTPFLAYICAVELLLQRHNLSRPPHLFSVSGIAGIRHRLNEESVQSFGMDRCTHCIDDASSYSKGIGKGHPRTSSFAWIGCWNRPGRTGRCSLCIAAHRARCAYTTPAVADAEILSGDALPKSRRQPIKLKFTVPKAGLPDENRPSPQSASPQLATPQQLQTTQMMENGSSQSTASPQLATPQQVQIRQMFRQMFENQQLSEFTPWHGLASAISDEQPSQCPIVTPTVNPNTQVKEAPESRPPSSTITPSLHLETTLSPQPEKSGLSPSALALVGQLVLQWDRIDGSLMPTIAANDPGKTSHFVEDAERFHAVVTRVVKSPEIDPRLTEQLFMKWVLMNHRMGDVIRAQDRALLNGLIADAAAVDGLVQLIARSCGLDGVLGSAAEA